MSYIFVSDIGDVIYSVFDDEGCLVYVMNKSRPLPSFSIAGWAHHHGGRATLGRAG